MIHSLEILFLWVLQLLESTQVEEPPQALQPWWELNMRVWLAGQKTLATTSQWLTPLGPTFPFIFTTFACALHFYCNWTGDEWLIHLALNPVVLQSTSPSHTLHLTQTCIRTEGETIEPGENMQSPNREARPGLKLKTFFLEVSVLFLKKKMWSGKCAEHTGRALSARRVQTHWQPAG